MTLKDWMPREGVSDAEMAARIGRVSPAWVRKLPCRAKAPSLRCATRIGIVTAGAVPASELLPKGAPAPAEKAA